MTVGHQSNIHFSTTAGMRLNHHGNFKVQRFQHLNTVNIKGDCARGSTVPQLRSTDEHFINLSNDSLPPRVG